MAKKKVPSNTALQVLHAMAETNALMSYSRFGATPFVRVGDLRVSTTTAHRLEKDGYIVEVGKPTFRSTDFAITEAGRKVVEENPPPPESERRLAITRGTRAAPAGFLVEIIRETPKRHYVKIASTGGQNTMDRWDVIRGPSPHNYVDAGDILYDNATEDQYKRLVELRDEHSAWKASLKSQKEDELRPILDRYADRARQKEQEIEMMAKEIFESPKAVKRVNNG